MDPILEEMGYDTANPEVSTEKPPYPAVPPTCTCDSLRLAENVALDRRKTHVSKDCREGIPGSVATFGADLASLANKRFAHSAFIDRTQ